VFLEIFPCITCLQWRIGVAHCTKVFEMIQNMLYILKVVESLTIKVDVTKFPQLIITYFKNLAWGLK
jgi:hypothetical protein